MIQDDEHLCLPLDIIMFILYLATSIKSVRDLILSEIVYRDSPILKMTWRKLFHILLPISQIALCICVIVFSTFCQPISDQILSHTILSASAGYIWLLCYLCNSLHWAFLTTNMENEKTRIWEYALKGLVVLLFIVGPVVFLILIGVTSKIHWVEIIYRILLDVIVMIVVFVSWYKLYNRLKIYTGLHMINRIKKRLTIQMLLYLLFFFICTVTFIVMVAVPTKPKYAWTHRFLFFFSEFFGTIPLVFVMLYFLSTGKPSSPSSTQGQPTTYSYSAGPSSSTSPALAEEPGEKVGQYYQFQRVNSCQEGYQVNDPYTTTSSYNNIGYYDMNDKEGYM